MEPKITVVDHVHLAYAEGDHTMVLSTDLRESELEFDLDGMKWEPPFEAEAVSRERKLEILRHILHWGHMQGWGSSIWLGRHGWYDGEHFVPPPSREAIARAFEAKGWRLDTSRQGVIRFERIIGEDS